MRQDSGGDAVLFSLPQIINMECIESLASEFKQLISSQNQVLILDASRVDVVTTAGLQLIISLQRTLSSLGRILLVRDSSEQFAVAARDTGLEILLSGGN